MSIGSRVVVVGIDGSDGSQGALAHAAWQAHRRGAALRLVYAHTVAIPFAVMGIGPDPDELVRAAKAGAEVLADAQTRVQLAFPELSVTTHVVTDSPGSALVAASAEADLVVVGSRGLGGFAGLLLGSVGTQLSAHGQCPVIVMRPPDERGVLGVGPTHAPVVVGIDGIPASTAALEFAFSEASARGAPLIATYAWWLLPPGGSGPMAPRTYDLEQAESEAHRMLSEAVAGWRERYPDVDVTLRPERAVNPVSGLLELSRSAGLLVVSRHGGNTLTRLLLGSISDITVREAQCPVAVVPEQSTEDR